MNRAPFQRSALTVGLLAFGAGLLLTSCVNVDEEVSRRPSELWKPPAESLPGQNVVVPGPRPSAASNQIGVKPLDLPTLLDISLENNPETRASWYQAKASAAAYGQSQSDYYPTVSVSGSVGREYAKNYLVQGTQNATTYGPSLTMNWLLFNFGQRSATADSARESLYAANFAFNQTYQDIVQQVVTAYYDLHAANSSLAATEASLENAKATYQAAKTKLETGLGNKQDMLRALADVKTVEAQMEVDYANIERSRAQLAAALGIKVGEYLQIEPPAAPPSFAEVDEGVSGLVALALQQRPDILQSYAETRSAEYDLAAAQAALWPELSLQAQGSYTHSINRTNNPMEYAQAALVLEWDIFQGFNKKYNIEKARSTLRSQEQAMLNQKIQVVSNVWTYYFAFRSAIKQVDASKEAVTAQQQAYDAISIGYNTGINSLLDLLTAQQDLDTSRQALVDAESRLANSVANLANAIGSLPQPAQRIEERYASEEMSKEQKEALAVDGLFRDSDPDPEPLTPQWMEKDEDAKDGSGASQPQADNAQGDKGTQRHDDGGQQGIHQPSQADDHSQQIIEDREAENVADGQLPPSADLE
ncbi:TolC family protein [Ruficoccus amylovorans]|uniref:TolC family protein n=1 Tax=Ruficoccus amylovorans TaxID=1804625 RepID=A0A842HFH1_9BACT|nr:TolC family protein [Ruficoccus amylovorans]MBC2594788.1 TolC family protein [Ruficoccus amylovorans]